MAIVVVAGGGDVEDVVGRTGVFVWGDIQLELAVEEEVGDAFDCSSDKTQDVTTGGVVMQGQLLFLPLTPEGRWLLPLKADIILYLDYPMKALG